MRNTSSSSDSSTSGSGGTTSALVDSVEQMVKLPFQMTGATWDFMMQGVRNLTGGSSDSSDAGAGYSASTTMNTSGNSTSGSNTGATSTTGSLSGLMTSNQDLSGDDLKYVVWSIVFTKPGYECVLEPQQSEIVNYSADGSTFAALKIAKVLEKARNGRLDRNESWVERNYPPESARDVERRTEVVTSGSDTTVVASTSTTGSTETSSHSRERSWRIPAEDQKFITFIYRVDWRLPKQEETVRVERVTIERNTTSSSRV
jgi:hypothetical protein